MLDAALVARGVVAVAVAVFLSHLASGIVSGHVPEDIPDRSGAVDGSRNLIQQRRRQEPAAPHDARRTDPNPDDQEHTVVTKNEEINGNDHAHGMGMYLRFGAMILTAMVVMYGVMFISSYELSHIRWSESRMFMAFTMGGTMGLIMLAWMSNMYKNVKANVAIVVGSILLLTVGAFLDRSQTTVDDTGFMNSMIPHHSMAITRSERFEVNDVRVCELAVEISEAQRREILEMDWLIEDIQRNGFAATAADAQARPVPDFQRSAERRCPRG